jgi:hypothetical protein
MAGGGARRRLAEVRVELLPRRAAEHLGAAVAERCGAVLPRGDEPGGEGAVLEVHLVPPLRAEKAPPDLRGEPFMTACFET